MTYYLGKVGRAGARLVSSCKDLYNDVNAAYLTGAIDVIVVKQRDGSLKSTPFHARFGKLGVLRTGDLKEVEIEVNGSPVDMRMNIDETGKIFTRAREDAKRDGDEKDVSTEVKVDQGQASEEIPVSQDQRNQHQTSQDQTLDLGQVATASLPISPPRSVAVDIEAISSDELISSSLPYNLEVLSDSAVEMSTDIVDGDEDTSRPIALSDTEVEVSDRRSANYWEHKSSRRKDHSSKGEVSAHVETGPSDDELRERLRQHGSMASSDADRSGFWNALTRILKRRHNRRFSSVEDGIYLDDIDYDSMDPEELSKFFPRNNSGSMETPSAEPAPADPVGSSGIGSSPAFSLSPAHSTHDLQKENISQLVATLDDVAFSLCGGLAQGTVTEDTFQNSFVSFSEFCTDPVSVLANPNLVVRINGKYYNWLVAGPLIMSSVVYLQTLPHKTHSKITNKYMPKKSQSFWNFWGRGQKEDDKAVEPERAKSEGATPEGSPHKWTPEEREKEGRTLMPPGGVAARQREVLSSDEEVTTQEVATRPRQRSLKRNKKIGFTNVLTSEQLESLNLLPGPNKVVFSITTKYQGTTRATCTVYLWNYNDKIVVSDIDGTITRSDVAGQVLPLLGMDWTQNGVVELFTAISKNGYKIVYLSARAIGQAGYTKDFLRKIRRGSHCLPDGPLFLFPFSLYTAFRKEVIEKRPEEFKIQCLQQIQAQFPEGFYSLHAGFGNRHNDVKSYMNVGIPESRIFTVNHKGIVRHELSLTFQSSYTSLMEIVDTQFPPLRCRLPSVHLEICEDSQEDIKEEYNTFNYWRTPMDIELPFDMPEVT